MIIKINFFCFLISFALQEVLAVTYAEYKKEVAITNRHIELAGDRLPDVIGNIIFQITAMEKIALMLAAPENIISCCLTKCKNYQKAMQNEILKVTSQPVPDAVNLNISWSQLGVDRRSRVKLALQAIIARFELDAIFRIAVKMCRLKGLLLSIQNPNAYIKKVILDDDGKCVLTDIDENIYIHNSVWDPSMESILHSS